MDGTKCHRAAQNRDGDRVDPVVFNEAPSAPAPRRCTVLHSRSMRPGPHNTCGVASGVRLPAVVVRLRPQCCGAFCTPWRRQYHTRRLPDRCERP
jgi:hypothetical protein